MADDIPDDFTVEELLRRIDSRWQKLQELLGALTPADWERPLGDGWPVKVHVAHLAAWERSALAILDGGSRPEAMGVPLDTWDRHDTDEINEHLAPSAGERSAGQARRDLDDSHKAIVARLNGMTRDQLLLPYSHYQPGPPENPRPVVGWVVGNTFGHYDEHIEWLEQGLIT
ncbi:MAG TPA: ClbS/DfsB family four-helix bundle protein [Tepidiformaceae bacterium]|nr:ClbS/DfsB family four-helix bundle protein [Tepidiformaceae bacterium]